MTFFPVLSILQGLRKSKKKKKKKKSPSPSSEMQTLLRAFIAVSAILIGLGVKDGGSEGETPAQFLERYERETLPRWNMVAEAAWQQKTNITDENTAAFVS